MEEHLWVAIRQEGSWIDGGGFLKLDLRVVKEYGFTQALDGQCFGIPQRRASGA